MRVLVLTICFCSVSARDSLETVLGRIREPQFRNAQYSVADFGAKGDGISDDLPAFTAAIRQANFDQGGTIETQEGKTYLLEGPLNLLSNVHVKLAAHVTLKFSAEYSKYLPAVLTKFEGTELFNYSPLIRAYEVTNVALTGAGPSSIIDGSGKQWFGKSSHDTNSLRKMGNDSVPVYQRVFGEGHKLPPVFVQPFGAVNVLLEGFYLTGSPFWTVHPVDSTNVIVRNLTVETRGTRNSDGCDPEGSTDVLIEGNSFNTGDDAIAIKAGRDADGWRIGRPTENIVIRHNKINSSANGISVGSEMSGGVSNVYAYENQLGKVGDAIYFKSNLDRGSWIRDVDVWNVTAEEAGGCLAFTNGYHGARGGFFPTLFEGFSISNCSCQNADKAISAKGVEAKPLQNVNITNLVVPNAHEGIEIANVINWRLHNVVVNGKATSQDINTTDSALIMV